MPRAVLEREPDSTDRSDELSWRTVLFNCDCHTFDQVERQLMKATGCSLGTARGFAWEAHRKGAVEVFEGGKEACRRVAEVLCEAGLRARATC